MSNLIITIISIALTAVVALAGIYYGGSAYQNYVVNTKANELLNVMQQIRKAALVWQLDNAGADYPSTDPTGGLSSCSSDYVEPNTGQTIQARYVLLECWIRSLTYNSRYLIADMDMPFYTNYLTGSAQGVQGHIKTNIVFGNFGALKNGTPDSFAQSMVRIDTSPSTSWPPTGKPVWYVRWLQQIHNYSQYNGGTTGISEGEARTFFIKLCHRLNQILGWEKPDGSYPNLPAGVTMNSNTTSSGYPINLPYTDVNATSIPNMCVINQSGTGIVDFQILLPL